MHRFWHILILSSLLLTAAGAPAGLAAVSPAQPSVPAEMEPEWVDYGSIQTLSTDGVLYYTTNHSGDDASNCVDHPDAYVYGRVSYSGGVYSNAQLETGCDAPEAGAMAADETHLYYTYSIFNGPATLYRQPVGGGPAEMLTDVHVAHAVTVDASKFYFFRDNPTFGGLELVKVDKVSLVTEIIAQFPGLGAGAVNFLVIDNGVLYWTEGETLTDGAVRSVPAGGGPVTTYAEADVELAYAIQVADDYIYWTELGGRIRRAALGGGAPETLYTSISQQKAAIYGLFVDASQAPAMLYFGMGGNNGSLWRMALGDQPVLMAFDRNFPHSTWLLGERLYWAEGSIYYLDQDAVSQGVDYVIDWMEVTQGVQDGGHTIDMVADKATYVRVYAREASGSAEKKLLAYLYGYDITGEPLHGSPLSPVALVDVDGDGATRAQPDQTFIFRVPADWTADAFRLQAVVNPPTNMQAFELDYLNNSYPNDPLTFGVTERPVCVFIYPAAALDDEGNVLIPDFESTLFEQSMERAEALLPADLFIYPQSDVLYKEIPEEGDPVAFDMTTGADRGALMGDLADLFENSDLPQSCDKDATAYAGFVHADIDSYDPDEDFNYGGQGNGSLQVMWSKMWGATAHQPFNQPRGAVTIAHEIGHVFDRPHIDCGSPANPDPDYPYDGCQRDDSDDEDAFWGFDGISLLAMDPIVDVADPDVGAGDLLSYRYNRWPSDYTWNAIYDAIGAAYQNLQTADLPEAALPEAGDTVWVRGVISTSNDGVISGALQPVYQFNESDLTEIQLAQLAESLANQGTQSEFAIELRAADQTLLYTQPFTPSAETEDPDTEPLLFHLTMPFEANSAELRLVARDSGEVLDAIQLSANPPSASITGFELLETGALSVSWNIQDADGGPWWVILQYSFDGQRRQALLVDGQASGGQFATLPLSGTVPGGALFLVATDGLQSSQVVTFTVRVPDQSPVAFITAPEDGGRLEPDYSIQLSGGGRDAEDGELPPEALAWYVDGTLVGNGPWLSVTGLALGAHTADLVVTDSQGQTTRAQVSFVIAPMYRMWIPVVAR